MPDTALITGASGGIGEDLARLFAAGGANLILVARSADKLRALADELSRAHSVSAEALPVDLGRAGAADEVATALSSRGAVVDVLVNNAGFGNYGLFSQIDPLAELQLLHLNIVTLTMLTRHVLPGMIERRHGRVLNVASTAAFQPGPLMATYYASKAYVLSFSEALFNETEGTGVTVTCLCPGPTHTGFQSRAGLGKARLFDVGHVMASAEVARAGYDGMMADKALVVPGLMNKIGVQSLRLAPRSLVRRFVRHLQGERTEKPRVKNLP
jgi:short-subunit dehydrogenase